MPMPSTIQATNSPTGPFAAESAASPTAKTTFVADRTGRPPQRSMARPAYGPSIADTMSAAEKAANTVGTETPRSRAIGAASIAGR